MINRKNIITMMVFFPGIALGCSESRRVSPHEDGGAIDRAKSDSDSGSRVDSDSESNRDPGKTSNVNSGLDAGTNLVSDIGTDSGFDTGIDSDKASGPVINAGALTSGELERLQRLGAGVGCGAVVVEQDVPLIERGLQSADPEAQEWSVLAIERLASCPDTFDAAVVETVFNGLLSVIKDKDPDLKEYAVRAIGSLAEETDLLTSRQATDSFEAALTLIEGDDFEDKRRGMNFLDDLMRILPADEKKASFDIMLGIFKEWLQSSATTWSEFTGTPEDRFQMSTTKALMRSCQYVEDEAQAISAYDALITALDSDRIALSAFSSVAFLAKLLPADQRAEAIDRVIAELANQRGWYSVTSGLYTPAHYANDALLILMPLLNDDEIVRALDALATQPSHPVFSETMELLNARLDE